AIPALMEGRAVVCNIRGFDSMERVKAAYPDSQFPDTARIIWVDTTTKQGRHKMACWFHWAPFGALIIIDETQQVYPDRRDFKLESLDKYIPDFGDIIEDIGLPEGRPEDVFTAYDKQRHYNWDIFCSTPNISKVKKEIREVSEWAYRHRNMSGVLPWWKNRWREFQHDPENTGKSLSHYAGTPKDYKADQRIFACYSSTATGAHSAVKTQDGLFKDPKLRVLAVVIALCVGWWVYQIFWGHSRISLNKDSPVPAAVLPDVDGRPHAVAADKGRPDALTLRNADGTAKPEKVRLTPQLIASLSINGVEPDQLVNMPEGCVVNRHRVRCMVGNSRQIRQLSRDFICNPKTCQVYFFVNKPDVQPDQKQPLFARAF
ncbi:MAG: zonular occludens toxin domain-containing protein, partial [Methylovulum sp.]|nr:zonular occludens toxin domain-containing protein [Methylovulum sp.]